MRRSCLDCGAAIDEGSRCSKCQSAYERDVRGRAGERGYGPEWFALRSRVVKEWREEFGNWCPGLPGRIAAHEASDLTGDHIVPLSAGGRNVRANVAVLCTRCNSAKGGGQHGPPRSVGARPLTQQASRRRPRQQPPPQVFIR